MNQYGIWNGVDRRFVFGIREDTKGKAWKKFCSIAPEAARKWRYETRVIPKDWKNPPKECWR